MPASLQSILDASGYLGTWETDLDTQIIELTGALPRVLAVDESQDATRVPVTAFLEGVHTEDRDRVAHLIHEAHSTAGRFEAEFRTCDRDGEVHWIAARGRVETDETGRGLRCIGLMADLTEARRDSQAAADHTMRTIDRVVDALIALRSVTKQLDSPVLPTLVDTMLLELGTILARKMGPSETDQVH
ncbi:PAS domain-containing protein [Methylobacterium sp. E-041]|uniref:PAS domain-containing protein n=1 Tax=unclassified Methylobacterium TaxID=2615210 RepID=UPI001FB90F8D|nr:MULTISPECIES: PAS domain-containing protein [unclassified Methylobacterium]MCJ2041668.1 PAS domain-containing protein [Methylobacterium sp. J-059]MCJ2107307.1 PAS domain-containing protein [Methylobacterium sp. E-041]MCJ2110252.1 PAS domain-containing protein [Methylobacterium sp. E-025]